ncbi:MAG TPA: gluconokinase [Anaerolineales bacterium]|nr:gluconokinase [Anaerolineales bacterium]
MRHEPRAVILMGVSGCGKTAVGRRLSQILGWPFFDGDDFHSPENVAKMSAGIPLQDADRLPWLATLHDLIAENLRAGKSILLACSALKQKYRDQLTRGNPGMSIVHLKGDFDLIFERMQKRYGHYMKVEMLHSQFEALEEPAEALNIDIAMNIGTIAEEIIARLNLKSS